MHLKVIFFITITSLNENKSFYLEVFVEHQKYINKIYIINNNNIINGKYTNDNSYIFKIDENGEYTICIESKLNHKLYEKINIKIEDDLSKIDYDKIYIDNIDKKNISINKIENEISIDISKLTESKLILFLFDNAGNQSKYRISIGYK